MTPFSSFNSFISSFIVSKGISNNMMKAGAQRRRTKAEKLADEAAEREKLTDIEQKIKLFADMEKELAEHRAN